MRRLTVLSVAMAMALFCASADAAVVSFLGTFDTKTLGAPGTGVFGGSVGPIADIDFDGLLDVTDGTGVITGGLYSDSAGSAITITGGTVTLTENGVNDTAAFNILVGGAALGNLTFTVQGDVITDSTINQANLSAFANIPTQGVLTDFANGGAQYSGELETIPEPGSMAVLLGLVGGVAGWRRRRA